MNNRIIFKGLFCLVLLFVLAGHKAIAQSKAAQAAVATAVESLRKAMVDADSVQLSQIVSSNLSYGHSSGVVQAKAAFIHSLTSGASDFVTMELTNQTIQVTGGTAIVRHTLLGTTNDGGKPGTVKLNIMLVWHKAKGGWQLLARQAFKVPAT